MTLRGFAVDSFRSLRSFRIDCGRITVVRGPNGCGKTNCYEALRLLHAAATGTLARTVAEAGGIASLHWAGQRRHHEEVRIAVEADTEAFLFRMAMGTPPPRAYGCKWDPTYPLTPSKFLLDPEVKEEDLSVRLPGRAKPVPLAQRRIHALTLTDAEGRRSTQGDPLDTGESMLAQIGDPARYGELALARQVFACWRFYHQFRTDAASPLREERIGVRTLSLGSDGVDLAAALQTVIEEGDGGAGRERLDDAIAEAFPGCRIDIVVDEANRFGIRMHRPGLFRPLTQRELSDGTLRFLALAAALLAPRSAPLLVFNEPEAGLHPDLIPALAALMVDASARSQVFVTTHDEALATALERADARMHTLALGEGRQQGCTVVVGQRAISG